MTVAARTPRGSGGPTVLLDRGTQLLAAAARRDVPTLVALTMAVTTVDPIELYRASIGRELCLWLQPSRDVALVGIDAAWSTQRSGPGRFEAASQDWRAFLAGALIDDGAAPGSVGPRCLGGFSFSDGPASSETWRPFGGSRLMLPSLLYSANSEGAWLTLSVVAEPGDAESDRLASLLATWERLVTAASAPPPEPSMSSLRLRAQLPEPQVWRDSVARLAGAVGRGRLDKAVLSRQVVLTAAADIDVPGVLCRLQESAPESTLFALGAGAATFIGATPERLVSLHGRGLRTMAMAGSARRAADPATDARLGVELMESDKEREEHAVVVAMLREALGPVVVQLEIAAVPEIVRLRHVQHLVTPVSGRLRDDADVLTVVGRLHPTPAVGGAPRELALELIEEEEPTERGWYAGPLGWVDRNGDGEFVVALRSGVVSGRQATLFAGCGIVADSDPEREWDESSAKLTTLGSALGSIEP